MPTTFLKNERNRLAFCFGRATALRATDNLIEQLREQVERERQQNAYNAAKGNGKSLY